MNNQQLDPIGLTSFGTYPAAWKKLSHLSTLMERVEPLKPLRRDHPEPFSFQLSRVRRTVCQPQTQLSSHFEGPHTI